MLLEPWVGDMAVLPMFPLGSVLFPHLPLSLRIFEERYLKLLGDLMTADNPEFGVVLIERGVEVGGEEKRFGIGTIAAVGDIGTTEEFYGLQAVGSQRFRVNAWLPDDPYPLADVDMLPELVWDEGLDALRSKTEQTVRKLLAFASEFGDLQYGADVELSDDPIESSWQLAGILPVGSLDQLDLLGSATAEELLTRTLEIAEVAFDTLTTMMADSEGEEL